MTTPGRFVRAGALLALLALVLQAFVAPAAAGSMAADPAVERAVERAVEDATEPDFGAIDRYVEAERRAQRIPGMTLAVVQGDRIVHLRGFGAADASGREVTPQTPFLIGSLAKSFTALAVMQLVEAGRLELDAPVQRYLPWFRVADAEASAAITLRHLLHQTSGLSGVVGNAWITNGDADDGALERRVRALRSAALARPVGAAYEYSNANYAVLGLVVQTVSGTTYERYIRAQIFAPLGMRRSFASEAEARPHGMARGHRYWFGVPRQADLPRGRGTTPAGYLVASAEDMARYLIAHLNGGRLDGAAVLSPAGIAALHRPAVEAGHPDASYAMGWSVVRDGDTTMVGHTGEALDFRATMALLPDRGLGYVLMMNADTGMGRGRMAAVTEGVHGLLLGREAAPTPSDAAQRALVFGALAAVVAVQLGGMARSVRTLRRRAAGPGRRPRGRWAVAGAIGLPLVLNAAWAALVLVALPRGLGASVGLLLLQLPDAGVVLVASGTLAAAWAAVRTGLVLVLARPTDSAARGTRQAAGRAPLPA